MSAVCYGSSFRKQEVNVFLFLGGLLPLPKYASSLYVMWRVVTRLDTGLYVPLVAKAQSVGVRLGLWVRQIGILCTPLN
jgi:hypothetical protein